MKGFGNNGMAQQTAVMCYAFMLMVVAIHRVHGTTPTDQAALSRQDALAATEILCRPTDKSVTLNAVAGFTADAFVKFGTASGTYDHQTPTTSFAATDPIVIKIDGLQANTRYYYRFCYRRSGSGDFIIRDEHSFITKRACGSTYTLTITADCHLYDKKGCGSLMRIVMQNAAKDNPDFYLDLGDTWGDDHNPTTITKEEIFKLQLDFRPYVGMLAHSAPFMFCIGNHEGEQGYWLLQTPPNNIATYATLARKFYYPNPYPDGFFTGNSAAEGNGMGLPENYYAWEWGDALFVVVDVYRHCTVNEKPQGWDWTIGKAQYDWFKQTLETSKAAYKFVFAHHLLGQGRGGVKLAKGFEWGGYEKDNVTYGFDTKRPGWETPIHQLMVKNGVQIFFQGHDHLFCKEILDNVIYQELPIACDSTYEIGMLANADAYVGDTMRGAGHLRVTVSPEETKVDYICAFLPADENAVQVNGKVYYSYTVKSTVPIHQTMNGARGDDCLVKIVRSSGLNGSMVITFIVPRTGKITAAIYDLNGRLVRWLADTKFDAGSYSVVWNGLNNTGVQTASSVYILKAAIDGRIYTKSLCSIK